MKDRKAGSALWHPAVCQAFGVATLQSNTKKKVEETKESTALPRTKKRTRSRRTGCPGKEETSRKSRLPQAELCSKSEPS